MINRIAEFLKTRDESVTPDEVDDAERIGSARAILELMLDPTEYMLDSGACYEDPNEYYKGHPVFDEGGISRDVYSAMINAALKETP